MVSPSILAPCCTLTLLNEPLRQNLVLIRAGFEVVSAGVQLKNDVYAQYVNLRWILILVEHDSHSGPV